MVLLLSLLLAADAGATIDYPAAKQRLEAQRATLARKLETARGAKEKTAALAAARAELLAEYDASLFPAWYGTKWDFNGTSQSPGEGLIACGYFVTTLLRDAGFGVQRVKLAQQSAENIVKSLVPAEKTLRFRELENAEVVKRIREAQGEGLYVIGMDYHVAYLRLTASEAKLCHSAYLEPAHVVCEDAATAGGMVSRYHVAGPLFSDAQLVAWAHGEPIRTVH